MRAFSDETLTRLEPDVAGDHRPLPAATVGPDAAAAPDAVGRGLRLRRLRSPSAPARLGLTETEVTAAASFYTLYKRQPGGRVPRRRLHQLAVRHHGRRPDPGHAGRPPRRRAGRAHRRRQGRVEHVECNAACDYAPVVMVNWEFFDNQTRSPPKAGRRPAGRRHVTPTRGPDRLCTWGRPTGSSPGSRRPGGRKGPSAGPASLVG